MKINYILGDNDHRSTTNLLKLLQKDICRNFIFAEKYYPTVFEEKLANEKNPVDLIGLACRSNKSLALLAMDSLLHYPFAEKLGINLSNYKHKTAAVIIDDKVSYCLILFANYINYSYL